jgi:hypothetical protein
MLETFHLKESFKVAPVFLPHDVMVGVDDDMIQNDYVSTVDGWIS